jgi:hypothetical protein
MANDWATSAAAQRSKIGIDLHLDLNGPRDLLTSAGLLSRTPGPPDWLALRGARGEMNMAEVAKQAGVTAWTGAWRLPPRPAREERRGSGRHHGRTARIGLGRTPASPTTRPGLRLWWPELLLSRLVFPTCETSLVAIALAVMLAS